MTKHYTKKPIYVK